MSSFLAEQFVRLRPDLSGFRTETQAEMTAALGGLAGGRSAAAATAAGVALGDALGGGLAQRTRTIELAGLTGATLRAQRPEIEAGIAASLAGTPALAGAAGVASGRAFGSGFAEQTRASLVGVRAAFGGAPIIGTTALVGGAILAGQALRSIVSEGATLEARLNELRVVSQATGGEMERLAGLARELGSDVSLPAVSAGDAAAAMTELSKAGLDVTDTLAGTRGVLELATAGNIDFAASAQIVASALNAFRLPGERASSVADLLAGASIEAQGEIADFGIAMQQAAAAAAQVGVPIEDAVTALTLLAQAGIQGSDAGTSFRTTLLRLVPTSKEAADLIEALGIKVADQEGRLRPLAAIFDDYRVALSKLPPVTRQAALTTIFGTDAFRAASVFAESGARGFDQVETAITRQGIAAEVAGAKAQGLRGDTAALASASETLAATLSRVTNPAIGGFARGLTDLVVGANIAAEGVGRAAGAFAQFVAPDFDFDAAGIDELLGKLQEAVDLTKKNEIDLDRVLSGDLRLPLEANLFRAIEAVRDELIPALQTGKLTVQEVDALLAGLNLPPGLSDAFVDLLQAPKAALDSFGGALARAGVAEADAAGRATGDAYTQATGEEITATERRAIDAAESMLSEVKRAGDEQITEAVRSARENFEGLGDSLADQLSEALDAGPIGQKIAALDAELAAMSERTSRRKLGFDLTEARRELTEAQEQVELVGVPTAEQKQAQAEFLAPFREKLADAKAALKEFDLSDHRDDLQTTLEKQKQLAEDGLVRLIGRFDDGKLSVEAFNRELTQRLGPSLDTLKSKAGDNLGLRFERDFLRDVENLREQAEAISGFLGRAGTAPGVNVSRPADTVAEVQRQIRDASTNLLQVQKEAKRQAHDDADGVERLLGQIRDALQGTRPPNSANPGGRGDERGDLTRVP
jgi:TP901 family phage tail tape measure protein